MIFLPSSSRGGQTVQRWLGYRGLWTEGIPTSTPALNVGVRVEALRGRYIQLGNPRNEAHDYWAESARQQPAFPSLDHLTDAT
jgi:hypothetical protein